MSRVDVIVPCYNYGRFLRQCVESVLAQDGVGVRVLIIDDCSGDDSEAVGRRLAAEDARVEYRRHAVNKGHHPTYNEGLEWLSGPYCMLLSADDVLTAGALARAVAVLESRPEVGMTHGKCIRTSRPEAEQCSPPAQFAVTVQSGYDFIRSRCQAGHNLVETPTVVGRTRIQKAIGPYHPDLPHSGDMHMWLRYGVHAAVAHLNVEQAFYRTHGQNMSEGYRGVRDLHEVKKTFDLFFTDGGSRVPDAGALRRLAYRGLVAQAFDVAYHALERGNLRMFTETIHFARQVDPWTRLAPRWIRLQVKRVVGGNLWSKLRACRRRLRADSRAGLHSYRSV